MFTSIFTSTLPYVDPALSSFTCGVLLLDKERVGEVIPDEEKSRHAPGAFADGGSLVEVNVLPHP